MNLEELNSLSSAQLEVVMQQLIDELSTKQHMPDIRDMSLLIHQISVLVLYIED